MAMIFMAVLMLMFVVMFVDIFRNLFHAIYKNRNVITQYSAFFNLIKPVNDIGNIYGIQSLNYAVFIIKQTK